MFLLITLRLAGATYVAGVTGVTGLYSAVAGACSVQCSARTAHNHGVRAFGPLGGVVTGAS